MDSVELERLMESQAEIWQYMFGFAVSMALKCAVELRLADIIHSHDGPITLSQIASSIDSPSPDVSYLYRIMRFLVRKNIFTAHHPSDGGETLYGPSKISIWILRDFELTLAPIIISMNHPWCLAPWHCFSQCVKEGGKAVTKAHGRGLWELASENPKFNKIFNEGMACTANISAMGILTKYEDGFKCIGSLVNVGGGTGKLIADIVEAHPHIKGINFDLPHVIATAPEYDGVSHIGGDMFKSIPNADAVFMKWIMHDWLDEDCVKILKNCRKAIPEKTGKVIIVDAVLKPDGNSAYDEMGLISDLCMFAHMGGKERTELEWKKLLDEAGFPRYKIISVAAILCVIEAYPE